MSFPYLSLTFGKPCLGWPPLVSFKVADEFHPGIQVINPRVLPSPPGAPNKINTTWFPQSFSRPALFHAIIYACKLHEDTVRGDVDDRRSYEIRLSYAEAIHELNKDLTNPADISLDQTILITFVLANFCFGSEKPRYRHSPNQGPLSNLQQLEVWGRYRVVPLHEEALLKLIRMRGGLEKIEMDGLAAYIVV